MVLFPDIPSLHDEALRFVPVEGLPEVTLGARVRRGRRQNLLERCIAIFEEELLREPDAHAKGASAPSATA